MHYQDIAQFKFSSGQEIVCEVMEWPDGDGNDIIIRNAMSIVAGETMEGERIYMFRPWVHYLEKANEYIIVNAQHVLSQNRPNEFLIKEYLDAVVTMHEHAKERDEEYIEAEKENLKRIQKGMTRFVNRSDEEETAKDNIVKFPSKDDTVH